MKYSYNKKNKGFSLIELIIAVAILVILTGLLAPQFMKYIDKAKKAKNMQTLDAIYTALQVVYAETPQSEMNEDRNGYINIYRNGPTSSWPPLEKRFYAELANSLGDKEMKKVEISVLVNSGEEDIDWEDNLSEFVIKYYYDDKTTDFYYLQKGFDEDFSGTYGEYLEDTKEYIAW